MRIEDYALIGNTVTAALVSRAGSIDWLCLPRFDGAACFSSLVGQPQNGRWLIGPRSGAQAVRRRYLGDTLILESEFETAEGRVLLVDFMPIAGRNPLVEVVRLVRGIEGSVPMRMELALRFDYGRSVPWVRRREYGLSAVAGPDAVKLRAPLKLRGENFVTYAEFNVSKGQEVALVLAWHPSHEDEPSARHPNRLLAETERFWLDWSARCAYQGPWREQVVRSLLTLKALTYAPTGGIVAAPTTSLPEKIGGPRNWDYRFCWLRDATFTLDALMSCGYVEEARAWRNWLLRAVAGKPDEIQILYGIAGERRLTEVELDWLDGYEGSRPVRIGNAAHRQFQLDVFGEILDALHMARSHGLEPAPESWQVQRVLLDFLESAWQRPDEGIWEVRGPRRHFTHSKVMAWVAFDRAVKAVERFGREGPTARWRALRDRIHADVCQHGFNSARGAFVQHYGADDLDASTLLIPLVGFLPASDPRVAATADAIAAKLAQDGLLLRYRAASGVDGLPPGEGAFLPCSFWLADNLALLGRIDEACRLFERLLSLANDVGLLSEEYDPQAGRQLGNFPQAFTHVALVNTAHSLGQADAGAGLIRRH